MDPLTALGLASNIVQFLDFTSKLFSTTQKLYFSPSGAKAEHLELEGLAQNIKELAEGVRPRNFPDTKIISNEDKTLLDLGNQCIEVANELLSVLESLKVKGDHRGWDSFYQALRSEWKKNDIVWLQRRLDRINNHLNARILLDQQAKVFSKLHELAAENRRLAASRTQEIDHLREDVHKLFEQIKQELQEKGAKSIALAQLSNAAEKGVEYFSELSILDFIRFDAIDERQKGVRNAHENTFSWIFRDSISAGQPRSSSYFGEWLKSNHTLFWVTGKPGSGKSTLMKFICEHKDIATNLEIWAKGHRLIIAQFFFWDAGRQALQKSQKGLLRSILYQILRQSPDLIPYASPGLWKSLIMGEARDPSMEHLTTTQLLDTFRCISTHLATSEARFCFFIDGLDEYEGKPDDIIRLIQVLNSSLQVKMCVSSRPWNEFEKAFGQDQSKKLYMQDLTRHDIRSYVRDILEEDIGLQELKLRDNRYGDLVQDIVDAAKGVFLWVVLVVRSLLEGLTNADRIVDLQRRLRLLPTDLNEYFERILFTVDNLYRKETAQMFQVTLMARDTLSLINYWFIDQEDPAFLDNLKVGPVEKRINDARLAQMQKRLNACCKGLLETQVTGSLILYQGTQRDFFYLKVDFLHRTVRDFLRIPDMQTVLDKWVGKEFDANIAICEALLAQVKTAPQEWTYFQSHGPMASIIETLFRHADLLEDSQYSPTTEIRLLEELQIALVSHMSVVGIVEQLLPISRRTGLNAYRHSDCLVLKEAVQNGLQHYASKKLDEWLRLPPSLQSDLLVCILLRFDSSPASVTRLRMIALLLKKGCDPNTPVGDKTAWTSFLEYECEYLRKGKSYDDTFPIIKNMLKHGADLNAACSLRKRGELVESHRAAEAVRMLITYDDARELGDLLTPSSRNSDGGEGKSNSSRRKWFIKMIFWDRKREPSNERGF